MEIEKREKRKRKIHLKQMIMDIGTGPFANIKLNK